MAETQGITQYQVEVQKQRRKRVIDLSVSLIRGPRGKQKLLGEAYTRTSSQPMIYFKVQNAEDEPTVYSEFLKLLVHRGFLPLRSRAYKNERFGEWKAVSLTGLDVRRILKQEGLSEDGREL